MPRLVNTSYDTMAAEKGAAITVPIPSAITVQDVSPAATPATNSQITTTSATITMSSWKEAPFHLTDKEIAEAMTGIIPMQASEAIKALGNQIDTDIMGLYTGIYGFAGSSGVTPFGSSVAEATEARKILNNQLCPLQDRRFVIDPDAEANALGLRAFQDMSFSGTNEGIADGLIRRKLGFDWFMDQNVPDHTCGTRTATNTTTNATAAVGDLTIAVTAGSGNTIAGDVFTVAGDTQTYVCSSVTNTAGGTITFTPAAKVAWATSAAITFKGTASTAYAQNLAFHRDAIAFATRPLVDIADGLGNIITAAVDPISKIALRLEVSREHKRTRFSYDILYGMALVRADLATRITG